MASLYVDIKAQDVTDRALVSARYTSAANAGASDVALTAANRNEIWKTVGGARAADAEDLRILSLTNPQEYSEYKRVAINEIKKVVEAAYISAYTQQKVAGLDEEDCKAAAKRQAMMIKDDQFKTLAIRFPASDDIISKNQRIKTDTALKY